MGKGKKKGKAGSEGAKASVFGTRSCIMRTMDLAWIGKDTSVDTRYGILGFEKVISSFPHRVTYGHTNCGQLSSF